MLNQFNGIGRLTKEPEIKQTTTGKKVAIFTLAINPDFRDGEASFIPVVAWNKTAEIVEKYLHKGSQCAVNGKVQTRSYQTDDGTKRYITEIVADRIYLLDKKSDIDGFKTITEAIDGDPF